MNLHYRDALFFRVLKNVAVNILAKVYVNLVKLPTLMKSLPVDLQSAREQYFEKCPCTVP